MPLFCVGEPSVNGGDSDSTADVGGEGVRYLSGRGPESCLKDLVVMMSGGGWDLLAWGVEACFRKPSSRQAGFTTFRKAAIHRFLIRMYQIPVTNITLPERLDIIQSGSWWWRGRG